MAGAIFSCKHRQSACISVCRMIFARFASITASQEAAIAQAQKSIARLNARPGYRCAA
jgi:hypothetical protein